jgi:hypothetical protein
MLPSLPAARGKLAESMVEYCKLSIFGSVTFNIPCWPGSPRIHGMRRLVSERRRPGLARLSAYRPGVVWARAGKSDAADASRSPSAGRARAVCLQSGY